MIGVIFAVIGCSFTILVTLLGTTWRLSSHIATLTAKVEPLAKLPERVARLEAMDEARESRTVH